MNINIWIDREKDFRIPTKCSIENKVLKTKGFHH